MHNATKSIGISIAAPIATAGFTPLSASNINLTENESATNKIEFLVMLEIVQKLIGSTILVPLKIAQLIVRHCSNIKTISPALISASPGLNPLNAPTSLANPKI
jgi:hypothetical protein